MQRLGNLGKPLILIDDDRRLKILIALKSLRLDLVLNFLGAQGVVLLDPFLHFCFHLEC